MNVNHSHPTETVELVALSTVPKGDLMQSDGILFVCVNLGENGRLGQIFKTQHLRLHYQEEFITLKK